MNRPRGFTLLEVMVALSLLGLLLVGAYTVAVGTMKAKKRINETAAVYTAGPEILDIVERDFRSAYIHSVKDLKAMKAQRQSFGGEECTIVDLVATTRSRGTMEVDDRDIRAEVTEVGYRLRTSDTYPGFLELYRREQFFFDDDLSRGGDYYLMYDRVKSFVVDFYEAPDDTENVSSIAKQEGKESWDSAETKTLPHAVKITLELGSPAEILDDPGADDRVFRFVRWVLSPTAYDKAPDENGNPPGNDGGNNQNPPGNTPGR